MKKTVNLMKRMLAFALAVVSVLTLFTFVQPIEADAATFKSSTSAEPANIQEIWFPAKTMSITQVGFENASHGNQNAIDLVCSTSLVAPFDGRVVYTDTRWGYVVLESIEKVRFANGIVDFACICFMHDNNINDMVKAQKNKTIIRQGTPMYQQGGMDNGKVRGETHVHLSVYRGKYTYPSKYGNGNVFAFDAFWINPEITTRYTGRGKGYAIKSVSKGAPRDYRDLWRDLDYFSDCTFYPALALTVQISKKTTLKTLPCSKKTCADSQDVRAGRMNERIRVVGLVKNTAGNYWFQVVIDGNKTAYLFAGDARMVESFFSTGLYHSVDGYHLVKDGKIIG